MVWYYTILYYIISVSYHITIYFLITGPPTLPPPQAIANNSFGDLTTISPTICSEKTLDFLCVYIYIYIYIYCQRGEFKSFFKSLFLFFLLLIFNVAEIVIKSPYTWQSTKWRNAAAAAGHPASSELPKRCREFCYWHMRWMKDNKHQ